MAVNIAYPWQHRTPSVTDYNKNSNIKIEMAFLFYKYHKLKKNVKVLIYNSLYPFNITALKS